MAKIDTDELLLKDMQVDGKTVTLLLEDGAKEEKYVKLPFVDESTCDFCYKTLLWALNANKRFTASQLTKKRLGGVQMTNGGSPMGRPYQLCKKFLQLLAEKVDKGRDVQYYADKLGVTPSYLFVVVRDFTGKSPSEIIASYVISASKYMLDNTNMSCQQIAKELKFSNQSFFGKYFRKYTGMSPLNYRKKRKNMLKD